MIFLLDKSLLKHNLKGEIFLGKMFKMDFQLFLVTLFNSLKRSVLRLKIVFEKCYILYFKILYQSRFW